MNVSLADLWTLACFTYKKEEKGEKVTYETYVEKFGAVAIDACLEKMKSENSPFIFKSGDSYHTSRSFEAAFKEIRNLM